jgi:hypothetical protein
MSAARLELKYPPSSDGGIRGAGVPVFRLELKYPPSSDGGIRRWVHERRKAGIEISTVFRRTVRRTEPRSKQNQSYLRTFQPSNLPTYNAVFT